MDSNKPNFIDLFSGCGGFSLGLKWAGCQELAAIDFDTDAVDVFKYNFPEMYNHVLKKDLQTFEPSELETLFQRTRVDFIIGGPPCQGFSTVRKRDGSNSGNRIIHDKRRELYQEFLRFIQYFQPKIFVMENVLGIRSAAGGKFFNTVQSEARMLGYHVHSETIKAWEFGVPQKRQRQLIIGTRFGLPLFSGQIYLRPTHTKNPNNLKLENFVSLGEAIGDLPPLESGTGLEVTQYDYELRRKHLERYTGRYIIDVLEVNKTALLTSHRARYHSERDLRDFARLLEGETGAQAISRGMEMESPYDKNSFKDRYTRQHRDSLCSTIVAHLSKDGLMFIHPTQNRSLTPREAARIQSFPDWFQFPVARTNQFRLIGNAVPPLIGKTVGEGIVHWFNDMELFLAAKPNISQHFETNVAFEELGDLLDSRNNLNKMTHEQFKRGWFAIAYFYYHLHPDSAKENGNIINDNPFISSGDLSKLDGRLVTPVYERSGWPVFLVQFAEEAYRRLEDGRLSMDDFYCSHIHIAGHEIFGRKINEDTQKWS